MSWVRYDDTFPDHPKVMRTGRDSLAVMGAHVVASCYAAKHETDGFVPDEYLRRHVPGRIIGHLLTVGLLEKVEAGFQVHDFLDFNPSKAQRNASRNAVTERVKRHRNAVGNAITSRARVSPTPSPTPVIPPSPPITEDEPYVVAYHTATGRAPSKLQRAKLYELHDRHSLAWLIENLTGPDPLGHCFEVDSEWQRARRKDVAAEEAAWKKQKRLERVRAAKAEVAREFFNPEPAA